MDMLNLISSKLINTIMKDNPENSNEPRTAIRGMSLENLRILMEVVAKVDGEEAAKNMTMAEVQVRYSKLVESLDGERTIAGEVVDDAEMKRVESAIQTGTVIRDAQKKVFGG